jgi:hypothetical protein
MPTISAPGWSNGELAITPVISSRSKFEGGAEVPFSFGDVGRSPPHYFSSRYRLAFRLEIVVACGVEADVIQSRYLDAEALAPTSIVDADVAIRLLGVIGAGRFERGEPPAEAGELIGRQLGNRSAISSTFMWRSIAGVGSGLRRALQDCPAKFTVLVRGLSKLYLDDHTTNRGTSGRCHPNITLTENAVPRTPGSNLHCFETSGPLGSRPSLTAFVRYRSAPPGRSLQRWAGRSRTRSACWPAGKWRRPIAGPWSTALVET